MNSLILASLFFIACLPALGANNPEAQELFANAEKQANLFHDQARPFQLEVDFLAQLNVPTQGHLTLKWEGKDRWRSEVSIGGFEQITVRKDDRLYTSRNAGFTPLRVGQLISLLHFATGHDGQVAKKLKRRVENGVEIDCIQTEPERVKGEAHEVCVGTTSREILSVEWHESPDEQRREQFSDYFDFGEVRYPHKLQLQEDGIKVLTANVISLQSATFEDTLLAAPKGAVERRQCTDMKRATPLKTPDPLYPKSASRNKIMGDTTVAMTVLTDGSVTDIQLIGKATQSMDDATLQTLKGWKFKPAMCGVDPVVSDIVVVVSFRLE
jgi:TonB family protein